MTWLSSSTTLLLGSVGYNGSNGSLGNRTASTTANCLGFVVPGTPGRYFVMSGSRMNVRKYGNPQPTTIVRPAAVSGYGASTLASAFSTRVLAAFSAAAVQFVVDFNLAVKTSLKIGGITTVCWLSRMTSSCSMRYCSWRRRVTVAAWAGAGRTTSPSTS